MPGLAVIRTHVHLTTVATVAVMSIANEMAVGCNWSSISFFHTHTHTQYIRPVYGMLTHAGGCRPQDATSTATRSAGVL
eukprot:1156235-Pelagomonas_calceolata.AAC.22